MIYKLVIKSHPEPVKLKLSIALWLKTSKSNMILTKSENILWDFIKIIGDQNQFLFTKFLQRTRSRVGKEQSVVHSLGNKISHIYIF